MAEKSRQVRRAELRREAFRAVNRHPVYKTFQRPKRRWLAREWATEWCGAEA